LAIIPDSKKGYADRRLALARPGDFIVVRL
jgi:hypothetical protein